MNAALALGLVTAYPVREVGAQGGGVVLPTHDPIAEVTLDGTPFDGAFGQGLADGAPLRHVLGLEDVAGRFRVWVDDGPLEAPDPSGCRARLWWIAWRKPSPQG